LNIIIELNDDCVCVCMYVCVCVHSNTIWINSLKGYHGIVKEYVEKLDKYLTFHIDQKDGLSCGFFCLYLSIQYLFDKTFDIDNEFVKKDFRRVCAYALGYIEGNGEEEYIPYKRWSNRRTYHHSHSLYISFL